MLHLYFFTACIASLYTATQQAYTWDEYLEFAENDESMACTMWRQSQPATFSIHDEIRCLQKALAAESQRAQAADERLASLQPAIDTAHNSVAAPNQKTDARASW